MADPTPPYFDTGRRRRSRRLLLISYHFPPGESAGALRWEKLVAHADRHGYGVDVVALAPEELSSRDDSRLQALEGDVRVYGVHRPPVLAEKVGDALRSLKNSLGPDALADTEEGSGSTLEESEQRRAIPKESIVDSGWSRRSLARSFNAVEDTLRFRAWARRSADRAMDILRAGEGHRAVVTCGPPHMVHTAGATVARRTDLPLVLDFRDPWCLLEKLHENVASPVWYRLAAHFERRCVEAARLVVLNTEPLTRAMRRRYPAAGDRMLCVMNGFDDENRSSTPREDRFLVAYAGSIYVDRDPRPLFEGAARVIRERELAPTRFGIEFLGHVSTFNGIPLSRLAEQAGIRDFVRIHPPVSREDAMRFLARAAVLVTLPQGLQYCIPSKVFEYMQFDAWLMAIAEAESATRDLLSRTSADVVLPDSPDEIARVLDQRFTEFEGGIRPRRIAGEEPWLSRRAQADRLFEAIEEIVGGDGLRPSATSQSASGLSATSL